jgi:hypothetical protein
MYELAFVSNVETKKFFGLCKLHQRILISTLPDFRGFIFKLYMFVRLIKVLNVALNYGPIDLFCQERLCISSSCIWTSLIFHSCD